MNFENNPTKQAPCKIHNIQNFIPVSPSFSERIKNNQKISEAELYRINVFLDGKVFEYIVNRDFFLKYVAKENTKESNFYDRDKENKSLNDRLVIQKIVSQMQWVCIKCFSESVQQNNEI